MGVIFILGWVTSELAIHVFLLNTFVVVVGLSLLGEIATFFLATIFGLLLVLLTNFVVHYVNLSNLCAQISKDIESKNHPVGIGKLSRQLSQRRIETNTARWLREFWRYIVTDFLYIIIINLIYLFIDCYSSFVS